VAELRKSEFLDRPDAGGAETEVAADLFVGARQTVLESDPHRKDVGLALRETVDRVSEGFDGARLLGLANRVLFIVMRNEVAENRTVLANRRLERHRIGNELGFDNRIERQAGLLGKLLRSGLAAELGEQTVPRAVERHQRVVE
jgi:hypothetical protein